MRKYTYDQIKQEFENRGYELVSTEYVNSNTKLEYICKVHKDKGVQQINLCHFHKGQGCRFCGAENKKNGKQKDLAGYNAKELTESKGMEFVKITREDGKLYIYYICPKHRQYGVQKTTLQSMRRKKIGCPYCIGRNKTTEVFKEELFKINPNIVILDEYISAKEPMRCKCKIDGTEWVSTANRLLKGAGCPECGRIASNQNSTKTNEKFLLQLKAVNEDIIPSEEYVQARTKIWVSCKVCGHKWQVTPDTLLQNGSCPECTKIELHNKQAKSNEQFLKELAEANPTLIPLEPYYNDHTKILVRCSVHNYEWYVAPNKILHRHTGCPKCVAYKNEQKLFSILKKYGYEVEPQKRFKDCKDKKPLPFDAYVEELNLLIEYDGEQHYIPIRRGNMSYKQAVEQLRIVQKHDEIKNQYCLDNNILLIRIPYWESDNMELFLLSKLKEYNLINNTKLI